MYRSNYIDITLNIFIAIRIFIIIKCIEKLSLFYTLYVLCFFHKVHMTSIFLLKVTILNVQLIEIKFDRNKMIFHGNISFD